MVASQKKRKANLPTPAIQTAPPEFRTDAGQVMQNLRAALAGLIAAIPSAEPVRRAADLQRVLKLRKTLAWQMFCVAHSPDPLTEAGRVPGDEAQARFFEAAKAGGVPASHIAAAATAFAAFEELVARHSGDRGSFLSMISGVAGVRDPQVDLHYKRAVFRGNSYLLGRSIRTLLRCTIARLDRKGPLDIAMIRGHVDSRVLAPGARHLMFSARLSRKGGPPLLAQPIWEPIEPDEAGSPGPGLLRDFCDPVPVQRRDLVGDDIPGCTEFTTSGVGRLSSVTCMLSGILRGQPSVFDDDAPALSSSESVCAPTETQVHDVLISRGFFKSRLPTVRVYSNLASQHIPFADRERDLLRLTETPMFLGTGVEVLHTPDVPRYPEMAQHVLGKLGWDPEEFDVYRCRIQYPVLPSTVVMRFDLRP